MHLGTQVEELGQSANGCGCHGGGANQVTPSLSGLPADGYVASSTYGLTIGGTGGPSGSRWGVQPRCRFR